MSKKPTGKKKASRFRRSTAHRGRRLPLMVGGGTFIVGLIAAMFVWLGASGKSPQAYALAPESALPAAVRRASPHVQEAYRFAIANRETLRWIPCFCGCGKEGHTSNADCYIKDVKPDGSVVFDFMSLH
jgi:hypothetical protein